MSVPGPSDRAGALSASGADDRAGAVFGALSDPTRRALLAAIAEHPAATATQLASELPISRQAVLKHLNALTDAGLLDRTRAGREVRYQFTPRPCRSGRVDGRGGRRVGRAPSRAPGQLTSSGTASAPAAR